MSDRGFVRGLLTGLGIAAAIVLALASGRTARPPETSEHRRDLLRFGLEPRGGRWAEAYAGRLRAALAGLPGGATVAAVECRQTTCLTRVVWPDRAAAVAHASALGITRYQGIDCRQSFALDGADRSGLFVVACD